MRWAGERGGAAGRAAGVLVGYSLAINRLWAGATRRESRAQSATEPWGRGHAGGLLIGWAVTMGREVGERGVQPATATMAAAMVAALPSFTLAIEMRPSRVK
mmetsp:Transcript_30174/g.97366  ORF Transcript_30174/g.97366 Transcript_30174/m.97366 type:complete len:102 (-) Transcript_30174:1188-1493(-)|eukprot:scaffold10424_cov134-Isochrysis_galbana.AAC.2